MGNMLKLVDMVSRNIKHWHNRHLINLIMKTVNTMSVMELSRGIRVM